MRRAMAEAEVGDDQYGEDPTVNVLEEAYAERVGKPAADVRPVGDHGQPDGAAGAVPPGAAGHGRPPPARRHLRGTARRPANAGIQFHAVDDDDGTISIRRRGLGPRGRRPPLPRARDRVRGADPHAVGGRALERSPPSRRWRGPPATLPVHMDGARLFNAEVATGSTAAALRRARDHRHVVSFQGPGRAGGLGPGRTGRRHGAGPGRAAPAGRRHAPGRGHRRRRARGAAHHGGAPGRRPRPGPAVGRGRGRTLARRGLRPRTVPTNMVDLPTTAPRRGSWTTSTARASWPGPIAPGVMRLVTHHDVDDAGLERAIKALPAPPKRPQKEER